MKYVYQLFNSDAREIVDLREYETEIIKAIRTVFEKIPIHVTEKTIEIDLPSPPYHIELSSMSRALMETDLYQFAVEKSIRKTIQGTLISNARSTMLDGYALYDEESRHNVLLTDYADDIIECVQHVNPDAVVHVYPHGFTVSSLTRGECNALGRAIAKSALSAFTVSVPYVRLIERTEDTKDDKA